MRQIQHVYGVTGVLLAWALVMASGSGECLAQASHSNDKSGSGGKSLLPPPPPPPPVIIQVPRTSGGRPNLPSTGAGLPSTGAKLPSTGAKLPAARADLPGRSNSGFSGGGGVPPQIQPPVTQPVQTVDSTTVIPIGRPNDPARVLREWRDFNARLRTPPPLTRETADLPVVRSGVTLGNGFRPPDRFLYQVIFRRGAGNFSVDFYNRLINTGLGSELGWQNTLLHNPYLRSLYEPYEICGTPRVINPGDSMHYDPTLSPNYDPQRAQQEAEKSQVAVTKTTAIERGEAAYADRDFAAAARAFKQALKENPGDHAAERAMGIAELMNENLVDGVSIVARAYLAEPSLADEAFTGSDLGLVEADLRELSGRVVGYANRTPTVASLVTAAVLLHGRDRVDAAVGMIERAGKVGLNADQAGMLKRAMKPGALIVAGSAPAPVIVKPAKHE